MDNFDLKKFLIENKLTYQEKMKEAAENQEIQAATKKAGEEIAKKMEDVLTPEEIDFLSKVYNTSNGKEMITKELDKELTEGHEIPDEGEFGMSKAEIKVRQILDKLNLVTAVSGVPTSLGGVYQQLQSHGDVPGFVAGLAMSALGVALLVVGTNRGLKGSAWKQGSGKQRSVNQSAFRKYGGF